MLTRMTEEDWAIVLEVFTACRSRRGDKGRDDRKFLTKNIERGKRVARQIETGMVFINTATWTQPDLPIGGVKNSGYGRELSALGIAEFVNKKLIRVA
jgi:hypothetical protein